jgi:hypothetical protein
MISDDRQTIGPTPERLAKAGEDVEAFTPDANLHHRAIRMLDGHILEQLASRDVISGDQYNAGTQFFADWYFSGLAASGVIDPGRVIVDGGETMRESDRKLSAMTRWKRAVQAVGMVHSNVLTAVVLLEESLTVYGRRRFHQKNEKLARLAATTALQGALEQLDCHYYGQRKTATRASHVDGYRPEIATP